MLELADVLACISLVAYLCFGKVELRGILTPGDIGRFVDFLHVR